MALPLRSFTQESLCCLWKISTCFIYSWNLLKCSSYGGGWREKERYRERAGERFLSLSTVCDLLQHSTIPFLSSPPSASYLLCSISLFAVISSCSRCLTAFCSSPSLALSLALSLSLSPVRMPSPNLMNQRSSHSGRWLPRETPHDRAYWARWCRV